MENQLLEAAKEALAFMREKGLNGQISAKLAKAIKKEQGK